MKQFCLFITITISAWLTPLSAQDDWEWPRAVIDGIAYSLETYDIDCEGGTFRTASVINPSELFIGYDKYSGDIVIPTRVEHDGFFYTVNSIFENCFAECKNLESVICPSIGSVMSYAFKDCPLLAKINFSNSDYLGAWIYSYGITDCPKLKELILPPHLSTLCDNAIEAAGLEKLELPESLNSIGDEALCLPSLKELVCHVKTPIGITASNPFGSGEKGISLKKCTLRVPAESVEAYKSSNHWKNFGQILPIEETGIAAIEAEVETGKTYDLLGCPASGKGVRIVNGKKTLVR